MSAHSVGYSGRKRLSKRIRRGPIDVPLGVTRAFRNVGDDDALLSVTILGGNQNDIG
tara:strand:+ start:72448 stop:72618 length:171 start_codon:yes stop_codon:yes gene_type:complete